VSTLVVLNTYQHLLIRWTELIKLTDEKHLHGMMGVELAGQTSPVV